MQVKNIIISAIYQNTLADHRGIVQFMVVDGKTPVAPFTNMV